MDLFYIAKWIGRLILPPAGNLLMMLTGWMLVRVGWRRTGRVLAWFGGASLLLLTLPICGNGLLQMLERYPALPAQGVLPDGPRAIVVLGMGRYAGAPEYGGDTVSRGGLERIRYAAALQRRTGLPLLASGGSFGPAEPSEAELMASVLNNEFGVPVRWLETTSRNTEENARQSRVLLNAAGISRVYLVTHAWHMPRAMEAFARAGLAPVAAPMGFGAPGGAVFGATSLVPDAGALRNSAYALHELLGRTWYRLRYGG